MASLGLNEFMTLTTTDRQFDIFVMIGGTVSFHYKNLRGHQCPSYQIDDFSVFSMEIWSAGPSCFYLQHSVDIYEFNNCKYDTEYLQVYCYLLIAFMLLATQSLFYV